MKKTKSVASELKVILEQKESELLHELKVRDGIAIEKSADHMDEIQYASERDLAILNAHRESKVLREVKAAIRRVQDGTIGICIECDQEINPKRLAVVPWASRCVHCQDVADRAAREGVEFLSDDLAMAG
ncbi:TraR/DksA family transcriptional regulator [Paludibaculum fermentans]|uniref:TraR/DksA family transcriptional regulator n=1 Tax=Paludibaculum fermentans TaxID=1473598 RepID=A0A7S7NNW2_PALFE|nr:TraR/DksA family transcriptional regulator [Paludibaculum fermentans]QOY87065.1 TraR/DksA family transcriptional regulator [Paludibaculum fermentans]